MPNKSQNEFLLVIIHSLSRNDGDHPLIHTELKLVEEHSAYTETHFLFSMKMPNKTSISQLPPLVKKNQSHRFVDSNPKKSPIQQNFGKTVDQIDFHYSISSLPKISATCSTNIVRNIFHFRGIWSFQIQGALSNYGNSGKRSAF